MIEIRVGAFYGRQVIATLRKKSKSGDYDYQLSIAPGKNRKEALTNMAKELTRLAKQAREMAKDE